jgi:GAF domain-containing protein
VEPAIVEGLVLPVQFDGIALGTLWVVSHDEERKFDAEDVRIMSALAYFTVAALRLNTGAQLSGSSAAD